MPADRPLRNLTRENLLGLYTELLEEPAHKKYNLRKELQGDRRQATVYANRWVTRDQYLEMARSEIRERGLEVPGEPPPAAEPTAPPEGGPVPAATEATEPSATPSAEPTGPTHAPLTGVTKGAVAEGIVEAPDTDA